jgi:iron complex transport system ATP-binding protein
MNQYSHKEKASLISFVSTEKPDIANLTVFNLVSLGRYSYTNWLGSLNDTDESIVSDSMKMAGISHLASHNINEISDGELQRVMIARTLAQGAPVIILDEPTAFLDLPNKFEILLLLRDLAWNEHKTIILSTHDLDIAMRLADILWIMTEDSLKQGAPEDFALNRGFGDIFANTGVSYDYNIGTIDAGINLTKEIALRCENPDIRFWLNKAFNRLGFKISENTELIIEIKEEKFICKKENIKKEFSSVYELCREIMNKE